MAFCQSLSTFQVLFYTSIIVFHSECVGVLS